MNPGTNSLSICPDMALIQMRSSKEEIFSLPTIWKENVAKVKSTPNKGENRQAAKRKLYSSGSTSEDEDKKNATLKKRKNSPSNDLSPLRVLSKPRTPQSAQRVNSVPLSERQQMALLMRQMTDESHLQANDPATNNCGTPNSPFLSGHNSSKKRPSSDAKALKRNKRGETPLHIAAIKGDAQMADKLIKAGVDLNIKDYAGWSPLHEACSHGFMQVARSLLEAGAHVNILGLDNDLPLHDAACNGHFQVVELLLKHGANPFFKNLKGESAIDVANGDDVIMLLKNGYVTNSNNSNSTTATTTSSTATNHSNHNNNNNNNNNRINMRSPATPESLTSNYEDEDRTQLKIDCSMTPPPALTIATELVTPIKLHSSSSSTLSSTPPSLHNHQSLQQSHKADNLHHYSLDPPILNGCTPYPVINNKNNVENNKNHRKKQQRYNEKTQSDIYSSAALTNNQQQQHKQHSQKQHHQQFSQKTPQKQTDQQHLMHQQQQQHHSQQQAWNYNISPGCNSENHQSHVSGIIQQQQQKNQQHFQQFQHHTQLQQTNEFIQDQLMKNSILNYPNGWKPVNGFVADKIVRGNDQKLETDTYTCTPLPTPPTSQSINNVVKSDLAMTPVQSSSSMVSSTSLTATNSLPSTTTPITSTQSNTTKSFMPQFEDISDAEDDDDMRRSEEASKMKNTPLVSGSATGLTNISHMLSSNISSNNLFRPATPSGYSTNSKNNINPTLNAHLAQSAWPNLNFGYPLANTSVQLPSSLNSIINSSSVNTLTSLPSTTSISTLNANLSYSLASLALHPGLLAQQAALWKGFSPANKLPNTSTSRESSISKAFSPNKIETFNHFNNANLTNLSFELLLQQSNILQNLPVDTKLLAASYEQVIPFLQMQMAKSAEVKQQQPPHLQEHHPLQQAQNQQYLQYQQQSTQQAQQPQHSRHDDKVQLFSPWHASPSKNNSPPKNNNIIINSSCSYTMNQSASNNIPIHLQNNGNNNSLDATKHQSGPPPHTLLIVDNNKSESKVITKNSSLPMNHNFNNNINNSSSDYLSDKKLNFSSFSLSPAPLTSFSSSLSLPAAPSSSSLSLSSSSFIPLSSSILRNALPLKFDIKDNLQSACIISTNSFISSCSSNATITNSTNNLPTSCIKTSNSSSCNNSFIINSMYPNTNLMNIASNNYCTNSQNCNKICSSINNGNGNNFSQCIIQPSDITTALDTLTMQQRQKLQQQQQLIAADLNSKLLDACTTPRMNSPVTTTTSCSQTGESVECSAEYSMSSSSPRVPPLKIVLPQKSGDVTIEKPQIVIPQQKISMPYVTGYAHTMEISLPATFVAASMSTATIPSAVSTKMTSCSDVISTTLTATKISSTSILKDKICAVDIQKHSGSINSFQSTYNIINSKNDHNIFNNATKCENVSNVCNTNDNVHSFHTNNKNNNNIINNTVINVTSCSNNDNNSKNVYNAAPMISNVECVPTKKRKTKHLFKTSGKDSDIETNVASKASSASTTSIALSTSTLGATTTSSNVEQATNILSTATSLTSSTTTITSTISTSDKKFSSPIESSSSRSTTASITATSSTVSVTTTATTSSIKQHQHVYDDVVTTQATKHSTERRVTRSTTASKQHRGQNRERRNSHNDSSGSKCETTITLSTSAIQSTSSTSFASSTAQASSLTLTLSTSSSAAAVPDNQINKFEEDEVVQTTGRKHKVKGHRLNHDLHSSRESNSPAYAIPLSSLGSVAAHSAMLKKPPNPYEIYLNFKKKTEEKRVRLSTMSPKPPPKFFDYLMMKGNYKLSQNASSLVKEEALTIFSPSLVPETLRGLYEEQERARNNLQTEHIKERERLTLLSEQETLRIYSRAGRATANQGECLSACAVLCSEDFCSPHDLDNGEGFGGAGGPKDSRSRFNGRHFNAWLQEIVDKYAKLKAKLISRHHQEADILHCTQKLDWEWGMKEKGLYDTQLTPTDIKTFVPLVHVDDELELSIT